MSSSTNPAHLRVLIVDDEYMVVHTLCTEIDWALCGMEVVATSENGQQALEKCAVYKPDLIVTDITMPVMDGLALMETVGHDFPDIRFIILTAHKEFGYAQHAVALGALDYLVKAPMNKPAMEATLHKARLRIMAEKEAQTRMNDANRLQLTHRWEIRKRAMEDLMRGQQHSNPFWMHALKSVYTGPNIQVRMGYVGLINRCSFLAKYPERDISLVDFAFHQAVYEIAGELTTAEAFPAGQACECWVMLAIPDHTSKSYSEGLLQHFIQRLEQWMSKYLNVPIVCGFSDASGDPAQLSALARAARDASGVIFYTEHQSCYFPHDYKQNVAQHIPDTEWKHLADRVLPYWSSIDTGARLKGMGILRDWTLAMQPSPAVLKRRTVVMMEEANLPLVRKDFQMLEDTCHSAVWFETVEDILLRSRTDIQHKKLGSQHAEIRKAIEYIYENLAETITLATVADHIHMNASYLSHLFKQETGENFLDFVTLKRIEKAKQLLTDMQLKNYELAERVGFTNYPHFCTVFKRVTGMTPNEYRRGLRM